MKTGHESRRTLRWPIALFALAIAAADPARGQCLQPPPGMIAWWDGDAVSGIAAYDLLDENHGTLSGTFAGGGVATGRVGQAFSFDGVDDQILVLASPSIQPVTNFSVSAWARADVVSGASRTIVSRYDSSCWNGSNDCLAFTLRIDGDAVPRAVFASDSGNAQVLAGSAVDTAWHHYAMTYTNAEAMLYVDGVAVSAIQPAQAVSSRTIPTAIGATASGSERFTGLIDEVQLYDIALSAAEVQSIFVAGSAGLCKATPSANACAAAPTGMVGWWDADAVSGSTIFDLANTSNGTSSGSLATGRVGQAFSLTGPNAHVLIPSTQPLQFVTDFSVAAWAKADNVNGATRTIVCRFDSSCWNGSNDCLAYILRIDGDAVPRAYFASDAGNPLVLAGSAVDTRWHHYAITYTGTSAVLYVDGVVVNSAAAGQNVSSKVIPTTIGANAAGLEYFSGLIDEVQIFNRALDGAEIQSIYAAGGGGLCKLAGAAGRIFVNDDAPPGGDGTTWQTAFSDLQDALEAAEAAAAANPNPSAAGAYQEIWVAAGAYYPSEPAPARSCTFQLRNRVALFGGLAGNENPATFDPRVDARNFAANTSILSGDIGVPNDLADNVYHVVSSSQNDPSARLDGFTITAGFASTTVGGGGMYVYRGSPTIANCTFSANHAPGSGRGGALWADGAYPTITNCSFAANTACYGGAIAVSPYFDFSSRPKVSNCTFADNVAWGCGLGEEGGGAIVALGGAPGVHASFELANCTFDSNSVAGGLGRGGAVNSASAFGSSLLMNCTLTGNSTVAQGGGLAVQSGAVRMVNSILWGNIDAGGTNESAQVFVDAGTADVTYSDILGLVSSGPYDDGTNVGGNPLFVDSGNRNLRLLSASPAIDAGNPSAPGLPSKDAAGRARTIGSAPDMGAYEFDPATDVTTAPSEAVRIYKTGTTAVPGRLMDYFIVVHNESASDVVDLHIAEFMEPWFSLVSTDPPATDVENNRIIHWYIPLLAGAETRVMSYSGRLDPQVPLNQLVYGCVTGGSGMTWEDFSDCLADRGGPLCMSPYVVECCKSFIDPPCETCPPCPVCEPCCYAAGPWVAGCMAGTMASCGFFNPYCDIQYVVGPYDPNEKLVLAETYIRPERRLVYPIHFENVGTMAAIDVFVTDVLDDDVDETTLELLSPDGSFDPETRTVRFALWGINLAPGAGGQVLYAVSPRAGLASGTEIRNTAMIQFEALPPMMTNEVVNVIDDVPPQGVMNSLPQSSPPWFQLSWGGTDAVGEIDKYTIFVSVDGAAFTSLLTTQETSVTYVGGANHTYAFICIATDTAGNSEIQDTVAEATTSTTNLQDATPPTLTIDPLTSPTDMPAQVITGQVSDPLVSGVASGVAGITVNGQPASIENGTYVGVAILAEGPNPVVVIATDHAGNQAMQSTQIVRCTPCDVNCDGSVNPFDIQPFLVLLDPTPPQACSPCAGDANLNGTVNPFDINAFLVCLSGP